MDKSYFEIALLIGNYLAGTLSREEEEQLEKWLNLSQENRAWFNKITSEAYQDKKHIASRKINVERGWQSLQAKKMKSGKKSPVFILRKRAWYAAGIAASIAILIGGIGLLQHNRQALREEVVQVNIADIKVPTLIESQENDRVLSYDSLEIKTRDRIYIVDKNTGESPAGENKVQDTLVRYKTIVIPAGYTYQVQLADGSKVTLNAGSRLKFPDPFPDSLREVELTGEGFFEVTKSERPFVVKAGKTLLTVYGTRFNLFFSEKLSISEAILVEGSIGLKADDKEVKISPNQRICYNMNTCSTQVDHVNPSDHITWLNNSFKYNNAPLNRIVFDIMQWYGIEITVNPAIAQENYSLEFDKSASLEWVVGALEKIINKDIKKEGGVYYIK